MRLWFHIPAKLPSTNNKPPSVDLGVCYFLRRKFGEREREREMGEKIWRGGEKVSVNTWLVLVSSFVSVNSFSCYLQLSTTSKNVNPILGYFVGC